MTIEEFVENHEYVDRWSYRIQWNGYKVYSIWAKSDEGACVGYPKHALEKDGEIRESTLEETIAIMKASRLEDDDDE